MRSWYTASELAGLPGMPVTPSAVIRAAKREGWTSRKRETGKGLEYAFAGLPEITQNALIAQEYAAKPLAAPAETALAVIPETQTLPAVREPKAPREIPSSKELTGYQRTVRDGRLVVVELVDELAGKLGSRAKAVDRIVAMAKAGTLPDGYAEAISRANARNGKKSKGAAATRTISRPSLYRLMQRRDAALAETDSAALAGNVLAPVSAGRVADHPWLPYLLDLYRIPSKPSVADCVRRLRLPEDVSAPSLRAAQYAISALPEPIREWGRDGRRVMRKHLPCSRRSRDGLWPMDIVSADGHLFKAYIRHPRSGKPQRPEVTIFMDQATRRVVGFSVGWAESQFVIQQAFREVVIDPRQGIMAMHYSDNGAYNGVQYRAILARLRVSPINSLPGNPQANGAQERLNRTLLVPAAKQMPLYCGKDMDKDAFKRRLAAARKTGAGLPDLTEFVAYLRAEIADYNAREHSALTLKGRRFSPDAAWAEAAAEGWEPTLLPDENLWELLPSELRQVDRGWVRLPWGRYFSRDLELYQKREVQVCFNPVDGAKVWVADLDGRLICEAAIEGNTRQFSSAVEHAIREREAGQIARAERKIENARAEAALPIEGEVLEGEASDLPYLGPSAEPSLTPVLTAIPSTALDSPAVSVQPESIPLRPEPSRVSAAIDDAKKYELLKTLRAEVAAGRDLPDAERAFMAGYGTSREAEINDKIWADWNAQWAQTAAG